jgi:hypothetical protein
VADNGAAPSLATVTRQSLPSRTSVNGTLGSAGSYTVINRAQGTFTGLRQVGRVARRGQVLYRMNGDPVVLLYGRVPAYRSPAEGATASGVTGRDVEQLNRARVALGYASRSQPNPSPDESSWATTAARERLQKHLGGPDREAGYGGRPACRRPAGAEALICQRGAAAGETLAGPRSGVPVVVGAWSFLGVSVAGCAVLVVACLAPGGGGQ